MSGDDIGQLIYLALLAFMVGGYFFTQSRQNLSKTAQQAAIWGLIFVGVIAGVGLWDTISNKVAPSQLISTGGDISIPQAEDGHYYVTLELNGQEIEFVVDTGATDLVLTAADAAAAGINVADLEFNGFANTANGEVRTAYTSIDRITLGGITSFNVPASVNGADMDGSLLGMSYLQTFARIEISNGVMVLHP